MSSFTFQINLREPTQKTSEKKAASTHRWLIVLISLLALLIFLLLLEGFLRLVGIRNPIRYQPVPTSDLFVCHDTLGWVLKPNAQSRHVGYEYDVLYSIDSAGHRLTPNSSNDSDLHVVCLGGSMTFGHGLNDNETIPNCIAQILNAKVWNLGVQGYSTDQSMLQLRSSINDLQPDFVILSFLPSHLERNACNPKWMNKLWTSGRDKPMFHFDNNKLQLTHVPGQVPDTLSSKLILQSETTSHPGGFFLS